MKTFKRLLLWFIVLGLGNNVTLPIHAAEPAPPVVLLRVPNGGIQPQAVVDAQGTLHLIYYKGDPKAGDIFYMRSTDDGATFSAPLRVNSQAGSAIAIGNIRGAQLAIGRNGRIHVAWNGSGQALPKSPLNLAASGMAVQPEANSPMLYSRLNDAGTAFEPQRNLMQITAGLDGGGSVAADDAGNVYVAWHGVTGNDRGEAKRRVWLARSSDDGRTFTRETPVWDQPTGACGCCGLRLGVDKAGAVELLYRSATQEVNRDPYLLHSTDHGQTFKGVRIDHWNIDSCPMSTFSFATAGPQPVAAWENENQVYMAAFDPTTLQVSAHAAADGGAAPHKYPVVASNAHGDVLLAWGAGMGWARGGAVNWQVFDAAGHPLPEAHGQHDGIPQWSLAAAFTRRDGRFGIVY